MGIYCNSSIFTSQSSQVSSILLLQIILIACEVYHFQLTISMLCRMFVKIGTYMTFSIRIFLCYLMPTGVAS